MPIITKIEIQKKNEDRVNIYVDDTFFMGVFKELVFTHNLKKGSVIDEENLREILKREMFISAKNKALSILSKCDQSEKRVIEKLSPDYEEDVIDEVLEFLRKYNFVNDNELGEKIVNTNLKLNKIGKNKIKQNLYVKGIDKNIVNELVDNIDSDLEYENALYLANKRYARMKNEDPKKAYQKLSSHLAYKGFGFDIIKSVLRKVLNNDEY